MKKTGFAVAMLLVACVSYYIGSRAATAPHAATAAAKKTLYACPMHPQYTSDKPGAAPCCGMPLELVESRDGPGQGKAVRPGAFRLTGEKQQLIGVRIGQAELTRGMQSTRMPGRVQPDETRTYVVNAAVDGWARTVSSRSTGSFVKKDESLATFYSKDFLPAQQSYFYALNTLERLKNAQFDSPEQLRLTNVQVWSNEDALEQLGMTQEQIAEVKKSREYVRSVVLRSPADGFILARSISTGQRFLKGQELYRIAELNRVWVTADVFQHESRLIKAGSAATVRYQGSAYQARISEILPQFDPGTRTLKVRLELDNPGYVLRPDMFVDVEFPVNLPESITIPADAVLDSGLTKTVYVVPEDGVFEPRLIETGWRFGDRLQVLSGLESGERIVTAGNFLLDSESRLRLAQSASKKASEHHPAAHASVPGKAAAMAHDPVCGMDVDQKVAAEAGRSAVYSGKTYYFCAEVCKKDFQKDPGSYFTKAPSFKGHMQPK
jgi:RND family efflux transporter MFP subunit